MKTVIREVRKDTAGRGDERKIRKMAGRGGRLDEKDKNDRGKDGTKRKEGEEEYYYNL
jgi:hypothetical protein